VNGIDWPAANPAYWPNPNSKTAARKPTETGVSGGKMVQISSFFLDEVERHPAGEILSGSCRVCPSLASRHTNVTISPTLNCRHSQQLRAFWRHLPSRAFTYTIDISAFNNSSFYNMLLIELSGLSPPPKS